MSKADVLLTFSCQGCEVMLRARSRLLLAARAVRPEFRVGVAIAAMGLALLAFVVAVVSGFRHSATVVDRLDRQSEQHLVLHYLERYGAEAVRAHRARITGDDAYRMLGEETPDARWADRYLGGYLWTNFDYDRIYLVSADGRLLRTWRRGQVDDGREFAGVAKVVRPLLQALADNRSADEAMAGTHPLADTDWPIDATGRPLVRQGSSLIATDAGTGILTVASVVPDRDVSAMTRAPNHLVTVRLMDADFLKEMGEALELPGLHLAAVPAKSRALNDLHLKAGDGQSLGWLVWTTSRPAGTIRQQVAPAFIAFLVCLIALLMAAATVVRALLRTTDELRAREAQAQHTALHDAMTGLPNRHSLHLELQRTLADVDLADEENFVLVGYLDIDHFKVINDTLGHHVGDELIRQVTHRLRAALPPEDFLARMGGDEFAVIRRPPMGTFPVSGLGALVMELFREPFVVFGHSIGTTASFGISRAPAHGVEAGELLCKADIALYRAKQRGRGRWRAFLPDMQQALAWRHELEVELRRALAREELLMAYQPVVSVEDGTICGFEALLRWQHPDLGALGPAVFVPIAEQSGLMQELGDFVLRRVFSDIRTWPGHEFSVNLSPTQIMSRGFVDRVRAIVAEFDTDPARIVFEVTEGVLLDRSARVDGVLAELKGMGFRIALDDFGTGYSSLSYLRSFAFDRIKVDRSFVQNIENDLDAQAILRAIVSLGKSLRMKVVAEGVETIVQRQLVHAAGCQLIQGYLYFPALTPAQVSALPGICTGNAWALRRA